MPLRKGKHFFQKFNGKITALQGVVFANISDNITWVADGSDLNPNGGCEKKRSFLVCLDLLLETSKKPPVHMP